MLAPVGLSTVLMTPVVTALARLIPGTRVTLELANVIIAEPVVQAAPVRDPAKAGTRLFVPVQGTGVVVAAVTE